MLLLAPRYWVRPAVLLTHSSIHQRLNLETENEIKFNRNYQALYKQLKDVYTKIGASDFYGVVGEKFEWRRHEKVRLWYPVAMAKRGWGGRRVFTSDTAICWTFLSKAVVASFRQWFRPNPSL